MSIPLIIGLVITFKFWVIPLVLSLIMLAIMLRPVRFSGGSWFGDLELMFRGFWIIPMMVVWLIYLSLRVIFNFPA